MALIDAKIIIADDLTGANDTALQYFLNGKSAKIITDLKQDFSASENTDVWAISTESRNIDKEASAMRVVKACEKLKDELKTDNFYKKIDSTLRGNVGAEIVAMLDTLKKDCAVIAPAYIEENRATIGGYQLLQGVVIERTQCALDPSAPIFDSYIPDILKRTLNSSLSDIIDCIGLNIVTKGAGPIITKIKELAEKGKKIIVADAMSNTDIEQIALAITKSGLDILPCGSAGLANALNKIEHSDEVTHVENTPNLPRLVVSGSATKLTSNQISKLKEEKPNCYFVNLSAQDIIKGLDDNLIREVCDKLNQGVDVVIHSSDIKNELKRDSISDILIDEGIAKDEFPSKITDYIAGFVREINLASNFILIIAGGETSYKCVQNIDSKYLEIIDAIAPSIPLCIDSNGKIITTKSGNFGTNSTLVDIINYFERTKKSV